MDTAAILGLLFLIVSVVASIFILVLGKRMRGSARALIREGDRLFVSGDFSAAVEKYEEAAKLSKRIKGLSGEAADDKQGAELHLRKGLLQLAQNPDPSGVVPLFKDAIQTFPEVNYFDLERLANGLQVPLSEKIYLAFREAELHYLQEFVTSPEHLPRSSVVIHIIPKIGAWAESFGEPEFKMQVTKSSINGRLVIELFMTVYQRKVRTTARDKYSAFDSEGLKTLTNEYITTEIAGDKNIKSYIASQLVNDMASVIKVIHSFVKGRRIMQEIDQVIIRETKYVPVYWYENLTGLLEGFPGQEVFKYRIHWWNYRVTVDCLTRTDLAEISRLPVLSAQAMNALWNIKEEQLRFEFVPA